MIPAFEIKVNGKDVTSRFAGIASFTYKDNRGFKADTLTITISDPEGEIEVPKDDAVISFSMGFEGETLEDKGTFIVDGSAEMGPPDIIQVFARSADIKKSFNVAKTRSFKATTLGQILEKIAQGQKLQPEINPALGGIPIPHLDQTNESDGHLVTRLGAQYGALATVKDGRLVFTPLSRGATPTGTPLEAVTVLKTDCDRFHYDNRQRTSEFGAVKAKYRDLAAAETKTVMVSTSKGDGEKIKTLPRTYPDHAQAKAAAEAEVRRLSDLGTWLELDMITGHPGILTETPIVPKGFKENITSIEWVCDQVTHTLNKAGLTSKLKIVPKTS